MGLVIKYVDKVLSLLPVRGMQAILQVNTSY